MVEPAVSGYLGKKKKKSASHTELRPEKKNIMRLERAVFAMYV